MSVNQAPVELAEEIVMFQSSTDKTPIQQRASSTDNDRSSGLDSWSKHEDKNDDLDDIKSPAPIQVNDQSVIPSDINNTYASLHVTPAHTNNDRFVHGERAGSEELITQARDLNKLDDLKLAIKVERNWFNQNLQTNNPSPSNAFNILQDPRFQVNDLI